MTFEEFNTEITVFVQALIDNEQEEAKKILLELFTKLEGDNSNDSDETTKIKAYFLLSILDLDEIDEIINNISNFQSITDKNYKFTDFLDKIISEKVKSEEKISSMEATNSNLKSTLQNVEKSNLNLQKRNENLCEISNEYDKLKEKSERLNAFESISEKLSENKLEIDLLTNFIELVVEIKNKNIDAANVIQALSTQMDTDIFKSLLDQGNIISDLDKEIEYLEKELGKCKDGK